MRTHKIIMFLGDSITGGSSKTTTQVGSYLTRKNNLSDGFWAVNGGWGGTTTGTGTTGGFLNMTQNWLNAYKNAYQEATPDLSIHHAVLMGGVNDVWGGAGGGAQAAADQAFTNLTNLAIDILAAGFGSVILCTPPANGAYQTTDPDYAEVQTAFWSGGTSLVNQLRNYTLPANTLLLDCFDLSEDSSAPGNLGNFGNTGTFPSTGDINGITVTRRNYVVSSSISDPANDFLHPNNAFMEDWARMVYATFLPVIPDLIPQP